MPLEIVLAYYRLLAKQLEDERKAQEEAQKEQSSSVNVPSMSSIKSMVDSYRK